MLQPIKESVEPDTGPNKALLDAVRKNDPDAVKSAFAEGGDPNARLILKNSDGSPAPRTSPRPILAMVGFAEDEPARLRAVTIFKEFVSRGADMKAVDDQGHSPIHRAAMLEDVDLLRLVLDKGADVQATAKGPILGGNVVNLIVMQTLRNKEDRTLPLLQLALERGANPNVYDGRGMVPLHNAALIGAPKTVALLLKYGADPGLPTKPKLGMGLNIVATPLELARRSGDPDVIRLLAASRKDMTPVEAAGIGDAASLKRYLDTGGDPNQKDAQGVTLLQLAAAAGEPETVKILLEHHADVNAKGPQDSTALHRAAIRGHREAALLLLKAGADPDAAQKRGNFLMSPLSLAVEASQPEMVALLLEHGVNLQAPANRSVLLTAVMNAGQAPRRVIGQPLGQRPNMDEVLQRQDRIYDLLVARVNVRKEGGPALCAALGREQFGIATDLVKRGADINAVDNEGKSVLMLTVESIGMNRDTTLDHQPKSEVEPVDREGMAFLRFLLSKKPTLNYINLNADPKAPAGEKETTALEVARMWKLKDVILLLQKNSAK